MMELLGVVLVAFVVMALAFVGMATGVLLGKNPLKGSCGGLGKLGFHCGCEEPCELKKRALGALAGDSTAAPKP